MTSQALRRFSGGYLALWFVLFGGSILIGDHLTVGLVDGLSAVPLPLVVMLGWLPCGLIVPVLLVGSARFAEPPMRRPWLILAAVCGLVLAVQVPMLLRRDRYSSQACRLAAQTPTGEALTAGLLGSFGAVLLWALLFQISNWLLGRIRGERVSFSDNTWGLRPRSRRVFAVGAAVSMLIGLGVALVI
ncbi:hypothetical protein AB0A95_26220 [Micromonospora sp. NPDC049230]|uniref:hypothetical protein n=1 Tax=Micromonospora sp. NPDC049230 TaxID=3155502 RepID=UPI0033E71F63